MHIPEHLWSDLLAALLFGVMAVIVMLIGYKLFDWLTPRCGFEEQLSKGNTSVAILLAGLFIALAVVLHAVLLGVLGG